MTISRLNQTFFTSTWILLPDNLFIVRLALLSSSLLSSLTLTSKIYLSLGLILFQGTLTSIEVTFTYWNSAWLEFLPFWTLAFLTLTQPQSCFHSFDIQRSKFTQNYLIKATLWCLMILSMVFYCRIFTEGETEIVKTIAKT